MSTHTKSHPLLQSLPTTVSSSSAFYTRREVKSADNGKKNSRPKDSVRTPRPTKAAQLRMAASAAKKVQEARLGGVPTRNRVQPGSKQTVSNARLNATGPAQSEAEEDGPGSAEAQERHTTDPSEQQGYICEPNYPSEIESYSLDLAPGMNYEGEFGEFWDAEEEIQIVEPWQKETPAALYEEPKGDRAYRSQSFRSFASSGVLSVHGGNRSAGESRRSSRPPSSSASSVGSGRFESSTGARTAPTRMVTAPGLALSSMRGASDARDYLYAQQPQQPTFRSIGLGFSHNGTSKAVTLPVRYPKQRHHLLLQYAFSTSPVNSILVGTPGTGPTVPSLFINPAREGNSSPKISSPVAHQKAVQLMEAKSPSSRGRNLEASGVAAYQPSRSGPDSTANAVSMYAEPPQLLSNGHGFYPGVSTTHSGNTAASPVLGSGMANGIPLVFTAGMTSAGSPQMSGQQPYQIVFQNAMTGSANGGPGQQSFLPGFPFSFMPGSNFPSAPAPESQAAQAAAEEKAEPTETTPEVPKKPTKQELNADIRLGGLGPDFLSAEYQRKLKLAKAKQEFADRIRVRNQLKAAVANSAANIKTSQ